MLRHTRGPLDLPGGSWKPPAADPGGQPGTDLEVTRNMHSCMSKYRFVRVRISILVLKIISGTWRPLEADPGGCWRLILEASQVQILRSNTIYIHVCLNIGLLGSGFQFLC